MKEHYFEHAQTLGTVLNRGAQAGAQTAACGHATLSQQEKDTRHIRRQLFVTSN
jgi:hypothetical protein